MPSPPEDFDALLNRVRQGDEIALAELIGQYEPEIRLVARLKLGPALRRYLDSLDIAQSVHLALLRGLRADKFAIGSPDHLVRLAVVMVQRKLARHLRLLYRRERLLALMAQRGDLLEVVGPIASRSVDPALDVLLRDAVEHLLNKLAGPDRRLVELRLQGYATAEAAHELGLDADVLRVRLGRLRKRLHEEGVLSDWL